MQRLVRLGRGVFLLGAMALLLVSRRAGGSSSQVIESGTMVLIIATVLTLPIAVYSVWRESDAKSRRNWLLLFGVCVLVLGAAFLWPNK